MESTKSDKALKCPLCNGDSEPFFQNRYCRCLTCKGIFLKPELLLSPAEERARYETHNNDVNDLRYQEFVSPIVNAITEQFSPENPGLDFGAGTGPVISSQLENSGYKIAQYDPFFCNNAELLNRKYDYIACCEVIEHFYVPARDFALMRGLLNPGGKIFCMTLLFEDNMDFAKWFYKNDPTHVFFYQKQTFAKIVELFHFNDCKIDTRLIELSTPSTR